MKTLSDEITKLCLNGEPCPPDLEILANRGNKLLGDLGIKFGVASDWAPWADKSYLTEDDYADPEIAANVKAIDDTEGQFELYGGRFIESLLYFIYDEDDFRSLISECEILEIPMEYTMDDVIPNPPSSITPSEFQDLRYNYHKEA